MTDPTTATSTATNQSTKANDPTTNVDIRSFTTLDQVREHIDVLDKKLIQLFNQRMTAQYNIDKQKHHINDNNNNNDLLSPKSPISKSNNSSITNDDSYDTVDRLIDINKIISGPLTDVAVKAIYNEIQQARSLLLKKPIIVLGCQSGDNIHVAAIKYLNSINKLHSIEIQCICDNDQYNINNNYISNSNTIDTIWNVVQNNIVQYGVVPMPIEQPNSVNNDNSSNNNINNSILQQSNTTVQQLISSNNYCDITTELLITHYYYLYTSYVDNTIHTVYIQPSILCIVEQWCRLYIPNVKIQVISSLHTACINVQQNKHTAVMCTELAAQLYNLHRVNTGVSDDKHNASTQQQQQQSTMDNTSVGQQRARYIVIVPHTNTSQQNNNSSSNSNNANKVPNNTIQQHNTTNDQQQLSDTYISTNYKTLFSFAVRDQTGDLHDAIRSFKDYNVNIIRIESHASRDRHKIWDYSFIAELIGHQYDIPVKSALTKLELQSRFVRILGSYRTIDLDNIS